MGALTRRRREAGRPEDFFEPDGGKLSISIEVSRVSNRIE